MIDSLTATPALAAAYAQARERYTNNSVTDAVKNTTSPERILEYDGKLIQKLYPIYQDEHHPSNFFDFSASLYQPTKHFGGKTFDTLYFNLAVIWVMILILYVTLYFDVLKRIMHTLERHRKYRRK